MSTIVRTQAADFAAVKRLALRVLEANFVTEPPVIAAKLAKAYDIEVFEAPFKPAYVRVAGFIDFAKKQILINAEDSPPRKNFTVAHELGHYLLKHHEQEGGYTVLLRDPDEMVKTTFEQEANCFAANVLVPDMFLREWLGNYPFATDLQLAKIFGVSAEVIRYRRLYL